MQLFYFKYKLLIPSPPDSLPTGTLTQDMERHTVTWKWLYDEHLMSNKGISLARDPKLYIHTWNKKDDEITTSPLLIEMTSLLKESYIAFLWASRQDVLLECVCLARAFLRATEWSHKFQIGLHVERANALLNAHMLTEIYMELTKPTGEINIPKSIPSRLKTLFMLTANQAPRINITSVYSTRWGIWVLSITSLWGYYCLMLKNYQEIKRTDIFIRCVPSCSLRAATLRMKKSKSKTMDMDLMGFKTEMRKDCCRIDACPRNKSLCVCVSILWAVFIF